MTVERGGDVQKQVRQDVQHRLASGTQTDDKTQIFNSVFFYLENFERVRGALWEINQHGYLDPLSACRDSTD